MPHFCARRQNSPLPCCHARPSSVPLPEIMLASVQRRHPLRGSPRLLGGRPWLHAVYGMELIPLNCPKTRLEQKRTLHSLRQNTMPQGMGEDEEDEGSGWAEEGITEGGVYVSAGG